MPKALNRLALVAVLLASAIAPASAFGSGYLYYSGTGGGGLIGRVGLDGSGNNPSFAAPGVGVGYVAANATHIFYVEGGSPAYIGRAKIDGTGVESRWLSQGSTNNGPAIAITSRYIYYVAGAGVSATIGRANIDGTGANATFATPGTNVSGLAADESHVYWTHDAGIGRMALDGSGLNGSLITTPQGRGIAVTPSHLYWTTSTGTVGRAALDGSGANASFISAAGSNPWGIAVSGDKIFWTTNSGRNSTIASANSDGTGLNASFVTGLPSTLFGLTTQYADSIPSTPPSYAVSVTKSGAGSGTVTSAPAGIDCGATCTATFTSGTSVTLTAAPAAGSTFAGWSGACTGTAKTCTVSVIAAVAATARFVPAAASTADPFRVKGGKIRTRVSVTGAGRVTFTGTLGRARRSTVVCTMTRTFKQRASAWMVCEPNAATQARREAGPVSVVLTMTFTPTGGKAKTSRVGTVVLPRIETAPSVVTG